MKVPKILEDEREITAVWMDDESGYIVGEPSGYDGICTKIVAYGEPGLHCDLPWFAIYQDETLFARVPAHLCETINYKTD